MDMTSLLAGLISAAGAIIVCLINNHYLRRESEKKNESTIMLINYQLEELKKEVGKHNKIVERTYEIERKQGVMEEQIKVANHRIDDLEKGDDRK